MISVRKQKTRSALAARMATAAAPTTTTTDAHTATATGAATWRIQCSSFNIRRAQLSAKMRNLKSDGCEMKREWTEKSNNDPHELRKGRDTVRGGRRARRKSEGRLDEAARQWRVTRSTASETMADRPALDTPTKKRGREGGRAAAKKETMDAKTAPGSLERGNEGE